MRDSACWCSGFFAQLGRSRTSGLNGGDLNMAAEVSCISVQGYPFKVRPYMLSTLIWKFHHVAYSVTHLVAKELGRHRNCQIKVI